MSTMVQPSLHVRVHINQGQQPLSITYHPHPPCCGMEDLSAELRGYLLSQMELKISATSRAEVHLLQSHPTTAPQLRICSEDTYTL